MSPLDERSARAALDPARPAVARLGIQRDPEDNAADIIEGWSAVETALRSLLGGSALAGQALVRELRQREILAISDAHKVLDFLAARERAGRVDYRPGEADLAAARDGFQAVEGRLISGPLPGASANASSYAPLATPGHASRIADVAASGGDYSSPVPVQAGGRGPGLFLGLALAGLLAVLGIGYFLSQGGSSSGNLQKGIELYQARSPVAARDRLLAAVRDDPKDVRARVYLGRVQRELGDTVSALASLTEAVQLDPNSAIALREMGTLLLARGQNTLARNFFVRAVAASPEDHDAQGLLGCALARLGSPEADKWAQRAGPGVWTSCIASARGMRPNVPPGTMLPPGQYPAPGQRPQATAPRL